MPTLSNTATLIWMVSNRLVDPGQSNDQRQRQEQDRHQHQPKTNIETNINTNTNTRTKTKTRTKPKPEPEAAPVAESGVRFGVDLSHDNKTFSDPPISEKSLSGNNRLHCRMECIGNHHD